MADLTKKDIEELKNSLLQLKTEILNQGSLRNGDDLIVSQEDLAEEGDLANHVIGQQISFSMRERQFAKLRAVEQALERIEDGTYGQCEECDEPIGKKRLQRQPWADLCIEHAEEFERYQARAKAA